MRSCIPRLPPCGGEEEGAAPQVDRTSPSAIVHSNVALLSAEQAVRTRLTARTSSDVSITTIGVDEFINTFRRSSPSGKSFSFVNFRVIARAICLTHREMLPYNQCFGPSRISL